MLTMIYTTLTSTSLMKTLMLTTEVIQISCLIVQRQRVKINYHSNKKMSQQQGFFYSINRFQKTRLCSKNLANVFAKIENAYDVINDSYLSSNTLIVNDSDHNSNTQIGRDAFENTKIKHVKAVILNHKAIVKLQNGSQIIFGDNTNQQEC